MSQDKQTNNIHMPDSSQPEPLESCSGDDPKFTYQCLKCEALHTSPSVDRVKCGCNIGMIRYIYPIDSNPPKCIPDLLEYIKKCLRKYIDTTEMNIELLAHWIMGTHFHIQFETYPILQLNARKQSGKSRTLKLTSTLSRNGDGSVSTSITETQLFRNKSRPLFFDEMESISSKEKNGLRELLNTVYKRGNKIVRYIERKNKSGDREYQEECYYPFYPTGIANINGLGDVLADRAIQIILQRSNKPLTKLIEDFSTNKEIQGLKKTLEQMKLKIPQGIFSQWNEYVQGFKVDDELRPFFDKVAKSEICGRPLEIFFPLFVIAERFGDLNKFIENVKAYLEMLEGEYIDNVDDLLQEFITKKYNDLLGFVKVSEILQKFRESIECPEEWINAKWLGRAIKRLGFVAAKRMINGHVEIKLQIRKEETLQTPQTKQTPQTLQNPTNNKTKDVELVDKIDKGERVICSYCAKSKPLKEMTFDYNGSPFCIDCTKKKEFYDKINNSQTDNLKDKGEETPHFDQYLRKVS